MNIYFVNKNSKQKGPYDITDQHRQKIITIGDVILRDTTEGIKFLFVVSDRNTWEDCKCAATIKVNVGLSSNNLLFSFDGIRRRKGNIEVLEKFQSISDSLALKDFFENAVSILSYQYDWWDVEVFQRVYGLTSVLDSKSVNTFGSSQQCLNEFLFESYLKDDALLLFHSLLENNHSLKEIYTKIRAEYPISFRQALKSFLNDHPNSTIYDKSEKG